MKDLLSLPQYYVANTLFDKQYLPRFEKLSEVMPVGILAEKYLRMINTFSQEMDRITRQGLTFLFLLLLYS